MTDITKCDGKKCPMKKECWRYTAPAEKLHQSYFLSTPIKKKECKYFWSKR